MAANLLTNVKKTIVDVEIRTEVGWTDSTVALHWIRAKGENYKQFVSNQSRKIFKTGIDNWRHVSGEQNPADIASRGTTKPLTNLWWDGPVWLQDKSSWPEDITTNPTSQSKGEARRIKDVLAIAIQDKNDPLHQVMSKYDLNKSIRITTWVQRFIQNSRGDQKRGQLTTDEIENATFMWIKESQKQAKRDEKFDKHSEQLNLQLDERGIYVCKGRLVGEYPIYLPTESVLTEKLVIAAHRQTLHGGVGFTMTKIREKY